MHKTVFRLLGSNIDRVVFQNNSSEVNNHGLNTLLSAGAGSWIRLENRKKLFFFLLLGKQVDLRMPVGEAQFSITTL